MQWHLSCNIDSDDYKNTHIHIVGIGDNGMEAAMGMDIQTGIEALKELPKREIEMIVGPSHRGTKLR